MRKSSFKPTPEIKKNLAWAQMRTVFGKAFDAPVFELDIAPAGSMYTTTGDLACFASALFAAENNTPNAILKKATLEQMWKTQFAAPDQKRDSDWDFLYPNSKGIAESGTAAQFTVFPHNSASCLTTNSL